MESHRRIGGSRALLPYEVEICETLGISVKEYFQFLDLIDAYDVEQKKGYEHIPHIVNMPSALIAMGFAHFVPTVAGYTILWGKIAVTLAIMAASYLLTPKPKEQSQGPRLEIGGVQGRSRFNPSSGFDSVQDLASLGSFIPLVYARQGVRVSSQLLWSQIRTTQYGQSMSAIVLFSNGEIGAKPQFESLALGESFLNDLPLSKQKVYFSRGARNNGRLQGVADSQTPSSSHDQYQKGSALNENNYLSRGEREYDDVDPFKVKVWTQTYSGGHANFEYRPSFSSVKTPSSSTKFGLYSPMPNGNAYKVNWELILLLRDADDGVKKDLRIKMGKLVHKYPRYVGITNAGESDFYSTAGNGVVLEPSQVKAAIDSSLGDLMVNYRIYHDTNESAWIDASITDPDPNKKWNKFSPWGSSDAKSVADTTREGVDDSVQIGEQFMVGSTLMTAVHEDNGNIWVGGAEGFSKAIRFKADEHGYLEFRNTDETRLPYESLIVQKVDLATFANSRQCNITEIGLKSTVWRQIAGFPNVNEMPSQARIGSYEKQNGSIALGTINKYIKRISCFKVQAKKINSGDDFVDISPKILAVQGSSPTAQYNAIFIHHDKLSQYEFRFLPVPGNVILNHVDDRVIHVLGYSEHLQSHRNNELDLTISYHAREGQLPLSGEIEEGSNLTNNPEWIRGGLGIGLPIVDDDGNVVTGAGVNNFTPSSQGDDLFSPPNYNFIHKIFQPDNRTTYTGIGTNNQYGTWTNVTQRNFKGVPADGGNAYYSPYHGIVATATPINSSDWIWNFHFGGTLIPLGSLSSVVLPIGQYPTSNNQFTKAVEELDHNGVGTGRWHRFRVAVNPSSLGGGEDWRRTVNGTYHFAVCVQRADRLPTPTETTVIRDTTTTRGVGSGLKVAVTTKTDGSNTFKTFALHASGDGYFDGDKATINNESPTVTLNLIGKEKPSNVPDVDEHSDWSSDGTAGFYTNYWHVTKHNRNTAIADYFLFDAESSSHENGSEHEITYINEIVHEDVGNVPQINYEKLAIGGIRIGASSSVTSFNSFSGFIQEGIKVDRLISDANPNSGTGYLTRNSLIASTDDFVEIAHDLLTNTVYGAGDLVGHDGVDRVSMIEGARYCRANGFRWNGVIDRKFNLREFIFENAGYNFLDFSILGGRFSLRPSFPMKEDYTIDFDATIDNKGIEIKALFTDGNMKDIKITFLTPEERKMFKATVIYRDDKINSRGIAGFPENIAKTYAYNPTPSVISSEIFRPTAEKLPEEVFDLSNWCTHERHAKLFAAIALSIRKDVDHGIVFQTPPSSAFGLIAGDYIRVLTESTHTSRFNNGSIDADGKVICRNNLSVNSPPTPINAYVWSPGSLGGITKVQFSVNSAGINSAGLKNKLFAQVDTTEEDRVYKVESITYGEEGFLQIAASHVPLTDDNKLAVLEHSNPDNETVFESYFPELTI